MIPSFLEKYRAEIEKYKLQSIRIEATPLDFKPTLAIKQSKFLGNPYWPISMKYPTSADGKPMIMIAQLNFGEIPILEHFPDSGILQLFIDSTDWYEDDKYKIVFHENTSQESITDFSFLTMDLYDESPVNTEHSLSFMYQTEYGGVDDVRFKMEFESMPFYDYIEILDEDQANEFMDFFGATGHKLGGYGAFTQEDPRDYNSDNTKNDIQLFQMDTDEEIMFGDSGVAHIFISLENLKNKRFDQAYFYWDCC